MADAPETDQTDAMLPLPEDGVNALSVWKTRIQASQDLIDRLKPDWDRNLDRYLVKRPQTAFKDEIVVPKDFANVEQKKAQLHFQTPEIQLEPMLPNLADAVAVFTPVINFYLGPHGVNAMAMVREVLTDALCPSGLFATKIAYEATIDGTKPVQTGTQPDPNWQPPPPMPGQVLGIPPQPPQVPVYAQVPNVISEHYVWERISPAKALIPEEFHGSDFDKAPWLGFEFLMDFAVAQRAFKLPADFNSFVTQDERRVGRQENSSDTRGLPKRVKGYEVWYKASLFDETEKNPDRLRVLVIIDGLDQPVKHMNSPYQTEQPDGSLGGMEGFPVHIGALRYVPDQAIPPSDCQMSRYQVEEISRGRTQMIQQRQRSIPLRIAPSGLGEEFFAKVEKNVWQGIIPVADEHYMQYGERGPVQEVARAQFPRENFEFDQVANRDLAEVWAADMNQNGVQNPTERTATEISTMQANSNVRLDAERTVFLDWFTKGAAKLGSLIQQFATDTSYVAIVGPDGQQRLQAWDKHAIQGKFAYKAKPNSSIRIDAAQVRAQNTQLYNLLAPSPYINQLELIKNVVSGKPSDAWDYGKLIVPPAPKPETKPSVSWAFKGDDCNPAVPQFPIVVEVMRQLGMPIDQGAIQAAQQASAMQTGMAAGAVPHGNIPAPPPLQSPGGGVPGGPLNKHQTERTGERVGPKVGAAA